MIPAKEINYPVEDHNRQMREKYIVRATQRGEELGAYLVAVIGLPPGPIELDPAVYGKDGTYFIVLGKKGEVAGSEDPPESKKGIKKFALGSTGREGEYVTQEFDIDKSIKEGALLYSPEGYVSYKRYNPFSDPPLVSPQGKTSLVTK